MTNLLIGNGLSISISNEFAYASLKEKVAHKFSAPVSRLFSRLDTDDFEHILTKIRDARDVIEAITDGQITFSGKITEEVKSKLIEAVQCMNPSTPSEHAIDPKLLNSALKNYRNIFTTNYDIYLYWARLGEDGFNIVDFFFNDKKFDRNNVDKNGSDAIYYLHGALFLFEIESKVTKLAKGDFPTLNEAIQDQIENQANYPLFVSEGSSKEKLASIKKNEYLSFCYDNFRAMEGRLDIYGHSLNPDVDGHIVDAIKHSNISTIRYYHYNLDQMSKFEFERLQSTLNALLDRQVEIIESSKHGLSQQPDRLLS